MAILKNQTQGNFTIVSNEILRDSNLKLFDRGLLITIIGLPDGWNFTIRGLASILPDGKSSIEAALTRLKALGYLKIYQERNDGKLGNNVIEICVPARSDLAENVENSDFVPCPENRDTGKRDTENRPQYNTNKLKTQKSNKEKSSSATERKSNDEKQNFNISKMMMMDSSKNKLKAQNLSVFRLQINYNKMIEEGVKQELLDALVNQMVDVATSSDAKIFTIQGKRYTKANVMDALKRIDENVMKYVIRSVMSVQSEINNPKLYFITSLFNASSSYAIKQSTGSAIGKMVTNKKIHDFDERSDNNWDAVELALLNKKSG